ncbi:hypothetical protein V5799_011793 [Amblyomma americanum]|uniref:Uncharacterized protein n=1 Tax=Amblyomma americanum TaxID=6943 RepID=A0AAQ4EGP0_AMBAM
MSGAENEVRFVALRDQIVLELPNSIAVDMLREKYMSNKTWVDICLSHTTSGGVHAQPCPDLEKRVSARSSSARFMYKKCKGRQPHSEALQDLESHSDNLRDVERVKEELYSAKEENKKLKDSVQQLEGAVRDLREECSTQKRKVGVLMQLLNYNA